MQFLNSDSIRLGEKAQKPKKPRDDYERVTPYGT